MQYQATQHVQTGLRLPLREARNTSPILPRRVSNPGPPIDDPSALPLLQVRWMPKALIKSENFQSHFQKKFLGHFHNFFEENFILF